MMDAQRILDLVGLFGALFGGLWAYVQFVAKPAILAEVEKRFVNREIYTLQNDYILKDLTEIKNEIKEIKQTLQGVKE
jgi:hypothetical protein